jgi:GNAT superfamily N-acetyltransferase
MKNKQVAKYKLVQVTEKDLPVLYDITQKAMEPVSIAIDGERIFSEFEKTQHYQNYVDEFFPQLCNTWLICAGNKPIGRLRVEENQASLFIGGIQILPEFQRQGIGTDICKNIIKRAKRSNKKVILWVHKVNTKAISFYRKLGFEITEEKVLQYKMEV